MPIKSLIFYLIIYSIASILFFLATQEKTIKINFGTKKMKCNTKLFYIGISFLIIWLISGWRYGIGTDYFSYRELYFNLTAHNDIIFTLKHYSSIEIGYVLINYLAKIIFNNVNYVFIISSFITIFFIYLSLWYYKDKFNIGIALFIYLILFHNISFNAVRQFIAISIYFYSYRYIIEKKFIKYILINIIALLFHQSIIIGLPLYFIVGKGNTKKIIRVFTYLSIGFIILNFNLIQEFIYNILLSIGYERYLNLDNISSIGIGAIIVRIPVIFLIIIYYKELLKCDSDNKVFIDIVIFEMIISLLGYKIDYFARALLQFQIVRCLLFSGIICSRKKFKEYPLITIIIILYVLGLWILDSSSGILKDSMPYMNIWGLKI